jgi:hypothetical protein
LLVDAPVIANIDDDESIREARKSLLHSLDYDSLRHVELIGASTAPIGFRGVCRGESR